ncbi:MAG: hypothetical protein Q9211_002644 [Gyalolechia sp. 1 TL-2023]
MTLAEPYCQTVAVLTWDSHNRRHPCGPEEPNLAWIWIQRAATIVQLAQEANRPLGAENDVEVTMTYAEPTPIERRIVFLTAIRAIRAMRDATEKGLDRPVIWMITHSLQRVSWKLASVTAAFARVFRPDHSRIAIVKTVAKLIEDRRFQKTVVWVKFNGQNTAAAGFFQG